MSTLPEIDAYIANAPGYAVPILEEIRSVFHEADPGIGEAVKWNAPHFVHDGIVGSMTAFRNHVRLIFWRGQFLEDPGHLLTPVGSRTDMGSVNIPTLDDLPERATLIAYVREAVDLNRRGIRTVRKRSDAGAPKLSGDLPDDLPDDLRKALEDHPEALESYAGLSPSHRREYTEWIIEAKRQETRKRRIATAVEWLAEGKPRNWKYMNK